MSSNHRGISFKINNENISGKSLKFQNRITHIWINQGSNKKLKEKVTRIF